MSFLSEYRYPDKRIVLQISIVLSVIIDSLLIVLSDSGEIHGSVVGYLLLVFPFFILYVIGFHFSLFIVDKIMQKKIFIANESPFDFLIKKINYLIFPYFISIFISFLMLIGPSFFLAYKIFYPKKE